MLTQTVESLSRLTTLTSEGQPSVSVSRGLVDENSFIHFIEEFFPELKGSREQGIAQFKNDQNETMLLFGNFDSVPYRVRFYGVHGAIDYLARDLSNLKDAAIEFLL
jgi:hypothetical protein